MVVYGSKKKEKKKRKRTKREQLLKDEEGCLGMGTHTPQQGVRPGAKNIFFR